MRLAVLVLCVSVTSGSYAGIFHDAISDLGMAELARTFDEAKIDRILVRQGATLSSEDRAAAAVLVTLGALAPEEMADQAIAAAKIREYMKVVRSGHPALMGRIGDVSLFHHMATAFDHTALLKDNQFLELLGKALADGVLTGYDLRRDAVYDELPAGLTFIYSQSSLKHMRQLVGLPRSEQVAGWVYITPKVSAFVYREDWGPASDSVVTLPGGVRVIQGREIAVMFRFDSKQDMARFHEIITRFAKKDSPDEPGLIANAWWQPFYYADEPFQDFEPISLVVLSNGSHEATLTVLEARTDEVVVALQDGPWELRTDRVWVNPPFFRFLNGGYK